MVLLSTYTLLIFFIKIKYIIAIYSRGQDLIKTCLCYIHGDMHAYMHTYIHEEYPLEYRLTVVYLPPPLSAAHLSAHQETMQYGGWRPLRHEN